ncbi:MAG: hypothetical protein WKF66_11030 [Pedobacter sp.]
MKKKTFVRALTIACILVIGTLNLSAQKGGESSKTPKQRVSSAKIIPGEVKVKKDRFIYIEVPSKKGYLEFHVDNSVEVHDLLRETKLAYKSDFARQNNKKSTFGWKLISKTDPSTAVYRVKLNKATGLYYWHSCNCAYCCWDDE